MRNNRCCKYPPPWVSARLKELKERLKSYLVREQEVLSKDGVKSYTIGPRSATRYDTSLRDIWDAIDKLQAEIADLEAMLSGCSPRRAVGVIPRDNY